jgi:hypothetical protein
MLSDILMPFLDLAAADPIEDHLAALRLFESVADDVVAVIPAPSGAGALEPGSPGRKGPGRPGPCPSVPAGEHGQFPSAASRSATIAGRS